MQRGWENRGEEVPENASLAFAALASLWYRSLQEMVIAMKQYPTDRASLERDCTEEFFVASGPGGQNRNRVETGGRLMHRPSGLSVTATERRSQYANRERAFERMAERLEKFQHRPATRIPTRSTATGRERRLQRKRRTGLIKRQRATAFHQDE